MGDDYYQHGHRWIEVPTLGLRPENTNNFGFASVLGEEGNPILGHPDPATVFVANYDSGKKKWVLVDKDGNQFKDAGGNVITASASLSDAQKAIARKLDWPDVRSLLGNFAEGAGEFVTSSGQTVSEGGIWNQGATYQTASLYTKRCFHCHNPVGFDATPPADPTLPYMYGIPFDAWQNTLKSGSTILATFPIGAPALDGPASDPLSDRIHGVQCEHCHGPGGTFQVPTDETTPKRVELCRDCHSSTDPTDPSVALDVLPNMSNGKSTWDTNKRIPFAPTADGESGVFTNHHSQGDEFRRSAHKAVRMMLYDKYGHPVTTDGKTLNTNRTNGKYIEQGCLMCHDPHKSVWHDLGGVRYADPTSEESIGTMCTHCHNTRSFKEWPQSNPQRVVAWYAIPLAEIKFFGWPLSFYMAAQGSLIIYVLIIWYYARAMRKLDLEYGVDEGDLQ